MGMEVTPKRAMPEELAPRATAFFLGVTRFPWLVVLISLVVMVLAVMNVTKIVRDTTVDVFMRPNHPALLYRNQVEEVFGLRDPVVIAVIRDGEDGIYTPASFELISQLTDILKTVDNVDPERVRSLATEKNIFGSREGLEVTPFLDPLPTTQDASRGVRAAIEAIPLYLGTLVARNGTGTLITAELMDQQIAGRTYETIEGIIDDLDIGDHRVLIAGEGAVGGYLSIYLNNDARRLQPLALVIIIAIMVAAFRTLSSFVVPLIIILAGAGGTMGIMGAAGIPYYIITAALPIILIAVAVADSIHLLSRIYEEQAMDPEAPKRVLIVRAMAVMWRPVVLTSLTTIAGFTGISLTSGMPPMFWFGTFASLGVLVALLYSLFFLPAMMCMLPLGASPAFHPNVRGESNDIIARMLGHVGTLSMAFTPFVMMLAGIFIGLGIGGATKLQVDRSRINYFAPSAEIYQAHHEINARFNGTNYLDFVVEAPDPEGLFDPDRLAEIEALQAYVETLPNVQSTVSIVDYLKQIHKSLHENDPDYYRLPDTAEMVAQYFLLYGAMGGPTDFEEEVDYDYQRALVRTQINESQYSIDRLLVGEVEAHVQDAFKDSDLSVKLSGRINLDYHWMKPLAWNHFLSIAVSLSMVFAVSALLFRSVVGGLMTLAPVTIAVVAVYAIMGFTGIWLEPATSMFAAISIGLGVDFTIHILDRIRFLIRDEGRSLEEAIPALYRTAGRALFLNFVAVFLGFGVLFLSEMPPLYRFGFMIAAAMAMNFFAAVILLPALVSVLRPKFCGFKRESAQ